MLYKIFYYGLIVLILNSCSTKKESIKVLSNIINNGYTFNSNEFKTELISKSTDTILISNLLFPSKKITTFSLDFDTLNNLNPFYMGYKVFWTNSTSKITLSQSEIYYFREQMNNDITYFKCKKICRKNKILIENDSIFNENFSYSYYKKKKIYSVYNFSKPIFNKKKDICLIGFYRSSNYRFYNSSNSKVHLLILKKINKNWEVIGFEKDVGSSH